MDSRKLGRKPKNIRSRNRILILDLYRKKETLSVSEIAGTVKLSRTTVVKINDSLLKENLIIEAGKGLSSDEGGKKPLMYQLNADKHYIITIHIEYEQIRFRVFNLALKTRFSGSLEIDRNLPFEEVLNHIKSLFQKAEGEVSVLRGRLLSLMGAIHGTVDSERGICHHATYFPSWGTDIPIADKIKHSLNLDIPIYIDNWIRFKAIAETRDAGISSDRNLVLIDAGWPGLSAGIVIQGQNYKGHNNISGEIGHMILTLDDDRLCGCGATGCFESLIQCSRLLEEARHMIPGYPDSLIATAAESRAEDLLNVIFKAANQGDPLGCKLMMKRVKFFAQGLANICVTIDPDIIILEGDYAGGGAFFRENLLKTFQKTTLPRMHKNVEIIFRETPSVTTKTLEGAAIYAFNRYFLNL